MRFPALAFLVGAFLVAGAAPAEAGAPGAAPKDDVLLHASGAAVLERAAARASVVVGTQTADTPQAALPGPLVVPIHVAAPLTFTPLSPAPLRSALVPAAAALPAGSGALAALGMLAWIVARRRG